MRTSKIIYSLTGAFILVQVFSQISLGQELTILHTNDIHSKLTGFSPETEYSPMTTNDDKTVGGFARLASFFKETRERFPENTLILDAGDFLMGSLFHTVEVETGFQTSLMKKIGYDYISLGNHEFDFGPKALSNIISAADKNGGLPQIIASNLVFSESSADDDELNELFKNGKIKPYVVFEKKGIKIGIFGLMGFDAASVAPASKPVKFSDPVKEAAKMAKYLKTKHKTDIIILLSHCGINRDLNGNTYSGEDIKLAKKAPEIDIIISGHTHVSTPEYFKTGNTYIVQTGSNGAEVGKIGLKYENGKIAEFNSEMVAIDDRISGNKEVNDEIEKLTGQIDKQYLLPSGLSYKKPIGKTGFDLNIDFSDLKNSNLGNFIADASNYYLKNTGNKTDFSLVASGTIRENLVAGQTGVITAPDIFKVMSLGMGTDNVPGYPLATIYITGHEVKQLMEALVMSGNKGGDGFIYFSGIKTWIDSKKGFIRKVKKVVINGSEVDLSRKNKTLYSVSANTYLLSFIGRIKKMSFGLLKVVPKDNNGIPVTDIYNQLADIDPGKEGIQEAKEWIALVEYLKSFEKTPDGIPVIPDSYKKCDDSVIDISK